MLKRFGIALALLSLLAAVAVGATWVWLERTLSPVSASPNEAQTIDFEVEAGDSFWRVTASLERQGLIRSARVARWFVEAEDPTMLSQSAGWQRLIDARTGRTKFWNTVSRDWFWVFEGGAHGGQKWPGESGGR